MTPQERAAALYRALGDGCDLSAPEQEKRDIEAITDALTDTRRAALLEARKAVVSEYLQDPVEDDPGDIAYDHAIRDAVEAIDRLAQEGS